jgi:succinate dehydrogenase/fumarate reductase flavoprotein subunit
VRGAGDVPIPGLYAAGGCGQGGVLLDGHGHHLAWAFVSGRHAARGALREEPALSANAREGFAAPVAAGERA